MNFKLSERLHPKGLMWKVMEQDTQGLPLASMHMQECTPTHVDTHINPTHHMHTNGHISKLHFRNLFQWKWIKYSHEKTRETRRRPQTWGDVGRCKEVRSLTAVKCIIESPRNLYVIHRLGGRDGGGAHT